MKKFIFTALSFAVAGGAFAQQSPIQDNGPRFKSANEVVTPKTKPVLGKSVLSGWYEPYDIAQKTAGAALPFKGYVQFVMPDSLAKYIDEGDTISRFQDISVGQTMDPKDDNIGFTDNPGLKLTKYTGYTLDSIYFAYLYVRNVDSIDDGMGGKVPVVDTLIINYFKMNGLSKGTLSGTPTNVFARPNWNRTTLMPTNMVYTQKIPLTNADSTSVVNADGGFENSWRSGIKQIAPDAPTPITVGPGSAVDNIIGFTINFKAGHPYDTNSVFIYQKDPTQFPLTNPRANYFGYRFLANEGTDDQQVPQLKFYGNSLRATKGAAYEPSSSAWQGYIPGTAFFDKMYFQSGFMITASNVGISEIKNDQFAMSNVYPNPAHVNETAITAFNMKQAGNVKISIINLVGQEVKTLVNATYPAGEHTADLNLSNIKPGVYFVNMMVNGVGATKKLTIIE